jgi:hypothetical protein
MLRYYDFACRCGHVHAELVEVPHGQKPDKAYILFCPRCKAKEKHTRMLSAPAVYLGEKQLSPRVCGGSFDTMGHQRQPPVPEFAGETLADFKDFVRTPEYREVKKQRAVVSANNKQKRARARAMKKDPTISFRHNPLPGDPSFK